MRERHSVRRGPNEIPASPSMRRVCVACAPPRVDVRRARSDTRQSVPRAFRCAPKCAARERLNFVSSIQIRDREFNDVNMDHMEAIWSMHPEWYDVIRQLNDDALENGFRV